MDAVLGCCVLLVVGPASPAEAAYATEPASLASALHPQRPAQAAVYLYHSWLSWLLICGPRCSRSHLSLSLSLFFWKKREGPRFTAKHTKVAPTTTCARVGAPFFRARKVSKEVRPLSYFPVKMN